jgi:hypothetical protein
MCASSICAAGRNGRQLAFNTFCSGRPPLIRPARLAEWSRCSRKPSIAKLGYLEGSGECDGVQSLMRPFTRFSYPNGRANRRSANPFAVYFALQHGLLHRGTTNSLPVASPKKIG